MKNRSEYRCRAEGASRKVAEAAGDGGNGEGDTEAGEQRGREFPQASGGLGPSLSMLPRPGGPARRLGLSRTGKLWQESFGPPPSQTTTRWDRNTGEESCLLTAPSLLSRGTRQQDSEQNQMRNERCATLYDSVGSVKRHLERLIASCLFLFLLRRIFFLLLTKARS